MFRVGRRPLFSATPRRRTLNAAQQCTLSQVITSSDMTLIHLFMLESFILVFTMLPPLTDVTLWDS